MDERHPRPLHKSSPDSSVQKEVYTPPCITFIKLAVEEALMSICKGGLGSGPMGPGCGGVTSGCMGGGS